MFVPRFIYFRVCCMIPYMPTLSSLTYRAEPVQTGYRTFPCLPSFFDRPCHSWHPHLSPRIIAPIRLTTATLERFGTQYES